MLDLDRTFYTHQLFTTKDGAGQQALFNVLAAYARFNPAIGYCQGMAFVAAVLLMVQPDEEDAFWILASLLKEDKYLKDYYTPTLSKIQHSLSLLTGLMIKLIPDIAFRFHEIGIIPLMFATPWFMCLFTSLPCWDTVLAIWDGFFLLGTDFLFASAISILKTCEKDLLRMMSISEVLPYLQKLPFNKMDKNALLPKIWDMVTHKNIHDFIANVEELILKKIDPITLLTALEKSPSMDEERKRRAMSDSEEQTPSLFRRFVARFTTPKTDKKSSVKQRSVSCPTVPEAKAALKGRQLFAASTMNLSVIGEDLMASPADPKPHVVSRDDLYVDVFPPVVKAPPEACFSPIIHRSGIVAAKDGNLIDLEEPHGVSPSTVDPMRYMLSPGQRRSFMEFTTPMRAGSTLSSAKTPATTNKVVLKEHNRAGYQPRQTILAQERPCNVITSEEAGIELAEINGALTPTKLKTAKLHLSSPENYPVHTWDI